MIGFQVGLVNVIRDDDVPFLPIINGYFYAGCFFAVCVMQLG